MKPEGSFYMCIEFQSKVPTQSKDVNQLSVIFDWPPFIYNERDERRPSFM